MALEMWVLLCSLAIAYFQRLALPVGEPQDTQTQICNEYLINESFVKTTIIRRRSPKLKYCNITYQSNGTNGTNITYDMMLLDKLIDQYKTFNLTITYHHVTLNSPITQSGVLSINNHQELPLFLKADIRHRHIRLNPDGMLGQEVDDQMALMDAQGTDDRVGLLPLSIGGARGSNVVPMARNVHKGIHGDDNDVRFVSELPSPFWKSTAEWIIAFLQFYPEGRVTWDVAVQYAEGVVGDPLRHRVYRPVGFARQFSAYTNHTDKKSLLYSTNQTTLLNNNDDACGRHFKYAIPRVPVKCRPVKSRGIGKLMSKNVWNTSHVSSFPYAIGNRTFFYGQCVMSGLRWFIQELLPNGKMGERISTGRRAFYYYIVFPYSMDGTQYFYSHRGNEGTYWFIQKLKPDGTIGSRMSDGNWAYSHRVSIPFTIEDRQYFYGQVDSISKWYIKELLPNGEMGNQTSEGHGISPVVFIHEVEYKHYLYSHDPVLLTWHNNELLPGGKMSKILKRGIWTEGHHTSVPYSFYGYNFFYGQNLYSGFSFVQVILPGGVMGQRMVGFKGDADERYELVFSYIVNQTMYMYGHNQITKGWIIREMLSDE